jgi:hypothetical protein
MFQRPVVSVDRCELFSLFQKNQTAQLSIGSVYVMTVTLKFYVLFVVPKRVKRAATNLVVDRPFLFFLLHRDTQLVLLAGKVQNPTQVP